MSIADLSGRGSTGILYRRDSPRLYAGEHCAKDEKSFPLYLAFEKAVYQSLG